MKIWKLAESSDNRRYGQQKNWSKHKASELDYPDLPSPIKQLYSRFDNSLVYRKVNSILSSQPCVYFLFMPNDTYKIGETTVGNLHDRLSNLMMLFSTVSNFVNQSLLPNYWRRHYLITFWV